MKNLDRLLPQGLDSDTQAWATVTALAPLRVKVDGDTAALPFTPDSIAGVLAVNDRVRVAFTTNDDPAFRGRRVVVLGKTGGELSAWTSYTPTWTTSGTAPSLGNGTLTGKWMRAGGLVIANVRLFAGSTTNFGTGEQRFGLPVASGAGWDTAAGSAVLLDSGTTRYSASCLVPSGQAYTLIVATSSNFVTDVIPFTWAQNDEITFQVLYQP